MSDHLYLWPMLYKENVGHSAAGKHSNVLSIFNAKHTYDSK